MKRARGTSGGRVRGTLCALTAVFALCPPALARQLPPGAEPTNPASAGVSGPATLAGVVVWALASNRELAAARLELARARARLRQAGLRPNPTLEIEHTSGRLAGSAGDRATSVGIALPLDVFGLRGRRIELAEAEVLAAEATIADRERTLAVEVRSLYAEALAAARELRVARELEEIDATTNRFVEVRVTEGETAPIELRLLETELERRRAESIVLEGRYRATLLRLAALAGVPAEMPFEPRDDLEGAPAQAAPATAEAVDTALRMRPDLRLARVEERAAEAGLRLALARGRPEVSAFGRYATGRSVLDETPVGPITDRDRAVTFGISITLPVFDRNQGGGTEASVALNQARLRREHAEDRVRAEVAAALARLDALERAVATYRTGVLARSEANLASVRGAYQIGAYRITELLAEQRRYAEAQREFTGLLAERARALAELDAAVGAPVPSTPRPPAFSKETARETPATPAPRYPGLGEAAPLAPSLRTRAGIPRSLPVAEDDDIPNPPIAKPATRPSTRPE